MNNRIASIFLIIVLVILFLCSCKEGKKTTDSNSFIGISNKNIAGIYNPNTTTIHPQYYVYHESEENSLLYVYLYLPELFYSKANPENIAKAQVKIDYQIFENYESGSMLDTASITLNIKQNQSQTSLVTYLKIKPINKNKYLILIKTKDVLRNKMNIGFIEVDKRDNLVSQNFVCKNAETFKTHFKPYYNPNQSLIITSEKNQGKNLFITKYQNLKIMPPPPFSSLPSPEFTFVKDTCIEEKFTQDYNFNTKEHGLFFFRFDTTEEKGMVLLNFGENFPNFSTVEELIEPLQYITTSTEYSELLQQPIKKVAMDNFWLGLTKNSNIAKELIRVYYNRATFANIYFTSLIPGWKTDRGMIYIMFGPPTVVNRTNTMERWVYGDRNNFKALTFNFRKNDHPLTSNHYVLLRSLEFKNAWYKSVETWKSGKIFTYE